MAFNQFPQKGGIPSGNTAGRPSGPVIGDTYYNGQLSLLEIYDGTNWVPSSAPPGIPTVTATDVGTGRNFASGAINFSFVAGVNGGTPYGYAGIAILGGVTYTTGNTTASTASIVVGGPGSYAVSGSAYNGFGASPLSVPGNLAVTTVPDAPTSVSGGSPTASSIVVSWTGPATGGKAISQYTVTPYIGANAQSTTTTSSTSVTVTGLSGATTYTFKVKATNDNGTGLDSTASAAVTTALGIDYLVVAGGGGGSNAVTSVYDGGAGGAGGLRCTVTATGGGGTLESPFSVTSGTNYTVTVGAGGAAVNRDTGNPGSNSVFSTITSTGGGFGAGNSPAAGSGGSGGGQGSGGTNGNGTANQGFAGLGGAGGGAGALPPGTGVGGVGVATVITGTSTFYAGGGGIGTNAGGSGGGGAGNLTGTGTNGTVNTGGGGGASRLTTNNSSAGGSGVVIFRYPDSKTITIGAGLTGTESSASGGYKRATITAGTGNVSWN